MTPIAVSSPDMTAVTLGVPAIDVGEKSSPLLMSQRAVVIATSPIHLKRPVHPQTERRCR